MSWSLTTDTHAGPDIRSAVEHIEPQDHVSEAQLAQIQEAKEKATDLINSGVLGDANILAGTDNCFRVKLSGHAAETPAPGDFITVQVEVMPPLETVAPEADSTAE
jgi:hypothetical protein